MEDNQDKENEEGTAENNPNNESIPSTQDSGEKII